MTFSNSGTTAPADMNTMAPSGTFTIEVSEAKWSELLAHITNVRGKVLNSSPITVRVAGQHVPGYVVTWEGP